jgi:O-antigen/teichoic acid export membrane protein
MQEASGPRLNIKEHPDLYRRSIKGGYWVIFLRLVINFLSFGKVLIIANFFFLEDLGIISIAVMMMEILSTLTETGFDAALVQKKENIHSYLDTAWTAGLVKGIILFAILYFAAPVLASIPKQVSEDKVALTISILRAMSICFLINGVRNVGTIYFQKELDFRKVFTLTFASSMTDVVLSVAFIFIFRSIWGVIAARIIAAVVSCIGSYILSSYRPRLHFEPGKARELWGFGKWIYGSNIIGYLISQGDNYFVCFYLGLPQLALYKYAYDFSTMPATHISEVVSSVSFPAYSKIQKDIPRLREAYLKVLKLTALLSIPASFLIFLLGSDFVHIFLPERMYPMIFVLQILSFKGLMASLNVTSGPLYRSVGRPKISWALAAFYFPIFAILIYPLTKIWGIAGTAAATIIPGLCISPVNVLMTCRILSSSLSTIMRAILLPLGASIVMACFVFLLKTMIFIRPDYVSFASLGIMAISIYGLAVWLLDGAAKQGIREIICEQVSLIKQRLW